MVTDRYRDATIKRLAAELHDLQTTPRYVIHFPIGNNGTISVPLEDLDDESIWDAQDRAEIAMGRRLEVDEDGIAISHTIYERLSHGRLVRRRTI